MHHAFPATLTMFYRAAGPVASIVPTLLIFAAFLGAIALAALAWRALHQRKHGYNLLAAHQNAAPPMQAPRPPLPPAPPMQLPLRRASLSVAHNMTAGAEAGAAAVAQLRLPRVRSADAWQQVNAVPPVAVSVSSTCNVLPDGIVKRSASRSMLDLPP